jgi:hypothetical protein
MFARLAGMSNCWALILNFEVIRRFRMSFSNHDLSFDSRSNCHVYWGLKSYVVEKKLLVDTSLRLY